MMETFTRQTGAAVWKLDRKVSLATIKQRHLFNQGIRHGSNPN